MVTHFVSFFPLFSPILDKDIRNHLSNDLYTDGHLVVCDRLMDAHGQHMATAAAVAAAANAGTYYQQMESPPCYTIATGLPTYDEALHQHQQHFSYGMKFMYPAITAVHHHPAIAGVYNNTLTATFKQQSVAQQQQQAQEQLMKQKAYKVSSVALEDEASLEVVVPASYDIAELHGLNLSAAGMGVTAPLLGVKADAGKSSTASLEEVITIRLDDMTPTAALPVTAATTHRPAMFYNELRRERDVGGKQQCNAVTIAWSH